MQRTLIAAAALLLGAQFTCSAAPAGGSQSALEQRFSQFELALSAKQYYQSTDSGVLAWQEGYLLEAYLCRYQQDHSTVWLDKFTRHADAIFASLAPDQDGRLGWRSIRYSIATAEAKREAGESLAQVLPKSLSISSPAFTASVTGHRYQIAFLDSTHYAVTDQDTGEVSPVREYASAKLLQDIPGVRMRIEGRAEKGDRFLITTQAAKPAEFLCHEAMVMAPAARFVEIVYADPKLLEAYGRQAARYFELLETKLLPKWDSCWRKLGKDQGAYFAQNDPSVRFHGVTLPHNQYLAMGRVYLALYRVTHAQPYLERALGMANFFKSRLTTKRGYFQWNYWDQAVAEDAQGAVMRGSEFTSFGGIDISFAVEAYQTGVVFTKKDLQQFCQTVLQVMWNHSEKAPLIGGRVSTGGMIADTVQGWLLLGKYHPKLGRILSKVVEDRVTEPSGWGALAVAQAIGCR